MSSDSINDEIRAIRRELAAAFDNDLALIVADLRQREAASGRAYVTLPPRRLKENQHETNDAPKIDLLES